MGRDPVASLRKRGKVNEARRAASRYYIVTGKDREGKEFSIQEHYKTEHAKGFWQIRRGEKEWRELHPGPALPLLSQEHFWQPEKKVVPKAKVAKGT